MRLVSAPQCVGTKRSYIQVRETLKILGVLLNLCLFPVVPFSVSLLLGAWP